MTSSDIRQLIESFARAWERLDVESVVACYEEDCIVESPIFHTIRGRIQLRATYRELFQMFFDARIQIEDIVIDREQDDRAVVLFTMTATNRTALLGVPSTGSRRAVHCTFIFRFRDGRIVSEARVYSLVGLLESLEKARTDLELKVAGEVQRALFPRTHHVGHYCEAVSASLPCRAIGGDFVEYVDLPSGDFGVALGDVSGKGPAAALLASMLQGIFSVEAAGGCSPSVILGRMNHDLLRRGIESRFATLVYGVLSADGRFVYSNAGHNPPMLLRGGVVHSLQVGGPILGVFGDAAFGEETLNLEAGDTVVMYTDGVTEAFNAAGDEFGERRLMSLVTMRGRIPSELLNAVFTAVREFCCDTVQSDDITMMAMRFR